MQFDMNNFRRFRHPGPAEIKPITVLVGENSSGKTSFAAGLRYIVESLSLKGEGSFNQEPFFIGAFDQIAHYRGGKAGRATEFSLSLHLSKDEIQQLGKGFFHDAFFLNKPVSSDCCTTLHFINARSQPVLSMVEFSNEALHLKLPRDQLPSFSITRLNTGKTRKIPASERSIFYKPASAMTDRNSMKPFIGAIQNWVYENKYARNKKNDRVNQEEKELLDVLTSTGLAASIFSETLVYSSAPFRTRPERTYSPVEAASSPEGSHIPILLAQAKAFEARKWNAIKNTLEAFGKKSEMFKKIDVKRLGNKESDPFQIIIQISQDRSNIIDVGYGVSQILPLLVETLINDESKIFIFQQPEVHLHPKAQAELGSYFLDFVQKSEKYVILETHSDFMIDRIRSDLKTKGFNINDYLSVLYFKRDQIETSITRINYDEEGNTINPPAGYRDFFVNEALKNLGL